MLLHNQQLSNGGYLADVAVVGEAQGKGTGLGQLPAGSAQDVGLALLRFHLNSSQPITVALLSSRREDPARQTSHD